MFSRLPDSDSLVLARKQRLRKFLQEELTLELSEEKTLITHARTEAAKFLGYEITVLHKDTKLTGREAKRNGIPIQISGDSQLLPTGLQHEHLGET